MHLPVLVASRVSEIEWEDPPESNHKGKHDAFAAALRERPGQWAVFKRRSSSSIAKAIKEGRYRSFLPVGHYEVRNANTSDNKSDLYIRYVGAKPVNSEQSDA